MTLKVNNFCGCTDLRTGSLIVGYLSLFGNFILSLYTAISLLVFVVGVNTSKIKVEDDYEKNMVIIFFALLCTVLFMVITNLIFVAVLLAGIHKNNRGLVKAYLIFNTIFLVFHAVTFFFGFTIAPMWMNVIRFVVTYALGVYFLLVIRSQYLDMDKSLRKPVIYSSA